MRLWGDGQNGCVPQTRFPLTISLTDKKGNSSQSGQALHSIFDPAEREMEEIANKGGHSHRLFSRVFQRSVPIPASLLLHNLESFLRKNLASVQLRMSLEIQCFFLNKHTQLSG